MLSLFNFNLLPDAASTCTLTFKFIIVSIYSKFSMIVQSRIITTKTLNYNHDYNIIGEDIILYNYIYIKFIFTKKFILTKKNSMLLTHKGLIKN